MRITLNEIVNVILECISEGYGYDPEYARQQQELMVQIEREANEMWNDILIKHDGILYPGQKVPERIRRNFLAQKAKLLRPDDAQVPSWFNLSKVKSERKKKAAEERSNEVLKKHRKLARMYSDKYMKTIITPDGRVIKKKIKKTKDGDGKKPVAENRYYWE